MSRKRLKSVIVLGNGEDSSGFVMPKMSLPSQYMEVDPDIELRFDDKIVPGHSQVLSLTSNVLKEAIKTGSGGAPNTKQGPLSIPMQGTCSTDWLTVVPFIYPGAEQPEVTWANLEPLLVLGDKYDMPSLASRAAKFLEAHQHELNSTEKDSKYIWKWLLLLDNAAAGKESLMESCIQRVAYFFKATCTRKNMEGLSKEAVGMLASALAGTMTFKKPIERGICPRCSNPGYDYGAIRPNGQRYSCQSGCGIYFG